MVFVERPSLSKYPSLHPPFLMSLIDFDCFFVGSWKHLPLANLKIRIPPPVEWKCPIHPDQLSPIMHDIRHVPWILFPPDNRSNSPNIIPFELPYAGGAGLGGGGIFSCNTFIHSYNLESV